MIYTYVLYEYYKTINSYHFFSHYFELEATESWKKLSCDILYHQKLNQRITDINAENADELLDIAKKRHVKKVDRGCSEI